MFETIQQFIRSFNHFYEDFQNISFSDVCPFVLTDFQDFEFCTSVPVPSENLVETAESDSTGESNSTEESDSEYLVETAESELEYSSDSDSDSNSNSDSEISVINIGSNHDEYHPPRLVSIEGNIGAGKSTLIEKLKKKHKNNKRILFLQEPVGLWESFIEKNTSKNILQKFYENPTKYAFAFQMMAFHTRQKLIQEAIINADYNVETIVMERSLDADHRIFANMLHEQGYMEDLEYQIYCYASQAGLKRFGVSGIIWLQVEPEECYRRIQDRNRKGESDISMDYLRKCEEFHKEWLGADLGFSCDVDGMHPETDLEKIEKYLDLD